jgi:hypothetical protein
LLGDGLYEEETQAIPHRRDSLMAGLGALRQRTQDLYSQIQVARSLSTEPQLEEENDEPPTMPSPYRPSDSRDESRRNEELHNYNLAMSFASVLSPSDRRDFFALFFVRFRDNPYRSFAEAAATFSIIAAELDAAEPGPLAV